MILKWESAIICWNNMLARLIPESKNFFLQIFIVLFFWEVEVFKWDQIRAKNLLNTYVKITVLRKNTKQLLLNPNWTDV